MLSFEAKSGKIGVLGGAGNTSQRAINPFMAGRKRVNYNSFSFPLPPIIGGSFMPDTTLPAQPQNLACTICLVAKPKSDFRKDGGFRDNYSYHCKACEEIYGFRRRDNPALKALKKYPTTQLQKSRAAKKARHLYRTDIKFRLTRIIDGQNRRAAKLDIPGVITIEEWLEVLAFYENKCAYCSRQTPQLQIDHFWPLAWYKHGFTRANNTADNLVPACHYCNFAKRDNNPFEFLAWKNGLLIELVG